LELVYLWVEDYKNIKKQGFNFSPRFSCEYDEDKNELTIDKNDDYIENFFDEDGNINVTAVVGKNGSGKSSLVKLLLKLFYMYSGSIDLDTTKQTNIFLIIHNGKEFKYLQYDNVASSNNILNMIFRDIRDKIKKIEVQELSKNDIEFFSVYYNYMLDTLSDGDKDDRWIKHCYHRNDTYESAVLLEPKKLIDDEEKIDIENLEYLTLQRFATIFKIGKENDFIKKYFNPNLVKIKLNKIKLLEKFHLMGQLTYGNPIVKYDGTFKADGKVFEDMAYEDAEKKVKDYLHDISLQDANNLYLALKLLEKNNLIKHEIYKVLRDKFRNSFKTEKIFEELLDEVEKYNNENIKDYLKDGNLDFEIEKLKNSLLFKTNILLDINKMEKINNSLEKKVELNEIKDLLIDLPPWIDVDYYENDKSYKSLSSGEKSFFSFIMSLIYQIKNIENMPKYKSINIFLDEVELGFHPQWQKEYLSAILLAIKDFDLDINLYFLSHSSFILSDIPKENVVFLDTDEKGNCTVVDGLKEKKQTFGANIHTLLSDSFFMEDGLIGEFAKSKIEDLINFLQNKKTKIQNYVEAEKLIEIIGEPVLQMRLEKMLENYKIEKQIETEDDVQNKIIELEQKLVKMRNGKNKSTK